ncbi:hypothetical protein Dimus_037690, partial [Dionaea muscipula]
MTPKSMIWLKLLEVEDEDMKKENPKDDGSEGASRDINDARPRSDPKITFIDDVLKEFMASIGEHDNPKDGQCWEMVIYQGPIVMESSPSTTPIHDHFEHAVKCILDGMVEQNRSITDLYELLESKIFTGNQKERLNWRKLDEIKTYLKNLSEELKRTTFILKKTMLEVVDLINGKIKDHSTLIELK